MKPILTGSSDFKKIIDNNGFYVDKTLLIKEIGELNAEVILFPRPRRFGKTLNLSMLQYFYEKTSENTQYLFESMAIWKEEKYREQQGQWPVISITFKDVKDETWEDAYKTIIEIISDEFKRHKSILANNNIDQLDREQFQSIMDKSADETTYGSSFKFLTRLFSEVYSKKAIVLIDEYDAPIQVAYLHGFYNKMIGFMRKLLSGVLKDNKWLERGILTGIMRVAKESIFSGLNNLKVYTMLNERFSDTFGFTQQEVDDALQAYSLQAHRDAIKQWYNGYQNGNTTIYNPWSVVNCMQENGKLETYWLNSSDNELVKQEIASCGANVYTALESLLEDKTVKVSINEDITINDLGLKTRKNLKKRENAVWALLFHTGYLTYRSYTLKNGKYECSFAIPNAEIKNLYHDLIVESVDQINADTETEIDELRFALQQGNSIKFAALLQKFVLRSTASRDLPFDECERNIHLFVLGILVLFEKEYAVRSNRESGYGFYDIMLMPKLPNYVGWVIEFKKVDKDRKEKIELVVDVALQQIKAKEYAEELRAQGIKTIVAVGVAVKGKKLLVKHEVLEKA